LRELVGAPLLVDDHVQDASFFADVAAYEELRLSSGRSIRAALIAIRFSCFGDLFTIWSTNEAGGWSVGSRPHRLSADVVERAIAEVERDGYIYVDGAKLNRSYTGRNPHLKNVSWWVRFFDYL
jgi:hypothetical protein